MSKSIRIALIDWNASVRSARRLILDATPNTAVVFESDGKTSDFELLPDLLVDVIVMDQQLEQRTGTEAFMTLRSKYSELEDVPQAVLTTPFELSELRVLAFGAGMHDLVSINSGPGGLVQAIRSAALGKVVIDLRELVGLLSLNPPSRLNNFDFTKAVNALPVRKKGLVQKLSVEWDVIRSGGSTRLTLELFAPLARPMGCLSAKELIIRLIQNGFVNAS